MLLELFPSILSVSNSLSSIEPLFSLFFVSEVGSNWGFLLTPASFISFIASAAASFTSLEPSPVRIRAWSITSGGISQETPLAIDDNAVIAVALILESRFVVSFKIILISLVKFS